MRWLPVVNEVMRKDLRRPPADALIKPVLLAALGGVAFASYPEYSQMPEYAALLQAGDEAALHGAGDCGDDDEGILQPNYGGFR